VPKFTLVVLTGAAPGREEEFDDWYESVHIPDVLSVDGVVAAQRFEFVDVQGGDPPEPRQLVLYEVDAPNVRAVQEAFARAHAEWSQEPERHRSDSNGGKFCAWYFMPSSERFVAGVQPKP
jgi:hypothetical protein